MPAVHQRSAARRDLVESAGMDVAERFLTSAETSFNDLAGQPTIGAPLTLRHPALAGMRKWRVKDFDDFLVFYLPRPDGGVSIVRVLHAARDWWSLLGIVDWRDGITCGPAHPAGPIRDLSVLLTFAFGRVDHGSGGTASGSGS